MKIESWAQTDIGLKRGSNQDSFLVDQDLGLYLVADGMGGHSGGEVASQMAVQTLQAVILQSVDKKNARPEDLLREAYSVASQRIYQRTLKENPELKGMGTTAVSVWIKGQVAYVGNVGDSRAYLFSRGQLWQITEDHSLVAEQIRAGLLTSENTKRFIGRNVITRSVGFEAAVECDVIQRPLQDGDMILLCSDGLTGLVTDERLAEILRTTEPSKAVSTCVEEAKRNGGDDNVTVMLIRAIGTF